MWTFLHDEISWRLSATDPLVSAAVSGFQSKIPFMKLNTTSTPNEVEPNASAGPNQVVEATNESHNRTTSFADDTLGLTSGNVSIIDIDRSIIDAVRTPASQSIIDYLKRPSVITSGLLAVGSARTIWTADCNTLVSALKIPRLNGIYTVRCDFEVTLQVNADRFQAGRYILAWIPQGGAGKDSTTGVEAKWKSMRLTNLTTITQLPHVEIDLAKQTHVTLNIPYTSICPWNEWSTSAGTMTRGNGTLCLCTYSALDPGSGGSADANYTIWGSLQNVDIGSASANQMDMPTKEAKAMGVGPVTATLSKVSQASSVLGTIPIIGPYASGLSWFTDLLSRSARIMGWSKPLNEEATSRMVRQVAPFSAVSDNVSLAKPLGVMSTNSTAPNDGAARTGIDEMSVDFIKSQYAFYLSTNWTTTQASGTNLVMISCIPSNMNSVWSKGVTHTPISFLSRNFTWYRGGMKFRFKLVKTEFHRGRLLVAFSPGPVSNTYSYMSTEYVYREVVDVSATSEFEVCVPYLLASPWTARGYTMGVLAVFVENELVAPTTVTTTVPILIETCGDDDFEVAIPDEFPLEPYCPSTNQMAEPYIVTPCIKLGPNKGVPKETLKYTIGESVNSIRQLIKRMQCLRPSGTGAAQVIGNGIYARLWAYAWWPVTQASTTTGALYRDVFYSDLINLWQSCYAMSNGSLRYAFRVDSSAKDNTIGVWAEGPLVVGAFNGMLTLLTPSTAYPPWDRVISVPSIDGLLEFQVPVWNNMIGRSTLLQYCNVSDSLPPAVSGRNALALWIGDAFGTNSFKVQVFRYAGDDYTMSRWVGVPPVVNHTA